MIGRRPAPSGGRRRPGCASTQPAARAHVGGPQQQVRAPGGAGPGPSRASRGHPSLSSTAPLHSPPPLVLPAPDPSAPSSATGTRIWAAGPGRGALRLRAPGARGSARGPLGRPGSAGGWRHRCPQRPGGGTDAGGGGAPLRLGRDTPARPGLLSLPIRLSAVYELGLFRGRFPGNSFPPEFHAWRARWSPVGGRG